MSFATLRHLSLAAMFLSLATADEPAATQRFALLVGVNEYEHNKLKPLHFAENDVSALAVVLKDAQYQVALLTTKGEGTDHKPTKANIEKRLTEILQKCHKGDTVLIAFSGHGLQFEGESDAFFCPCDAKPFKADSNTLVSIGKIYSDLDRSFATMKVLLVDACRDDPAAGRGASRGVTSATAPPPPHGLAALFSCGEGEQAFEAPKLKHGVFFYHVIEGLKGSAANGDQEVTFSGLASYVARRVRRDVTEMIGDGATQSPNLKADYNVEPVLLSATRGQTVNDQLRTDWLEFRRMWELELGRKFRQDRAALRLDAWRLAAEAGDPRGLALYGACLVHGDGIKKNPTEGAALMRKAAEQGDVAMMVLYGNVLSNGVAIPPDFAEAVRWYRKAADREYDGGLTALGWMLAEGHGIPKDEIEAIKLFRKAAEHGSPQGQNALGKMLFDGRGVTKDEKEAVEWFRKAADKGHTFAMNWIGNAFWTGRGVAKNQAESVQWYRKTAELGSADGQFAMGFALENGIGVLKNVDEAINWYRKAAAQNNAESIKALNRLGAKR